MSQKQHKSRQKRYIGIILAFLAGLLAAVWLGLRVPPRAYRPVAAENPDQVSPYLTHRLGPDFYNQVQLDEPFELIIDQAGLNDILSRDVWPQWYGEVSVGIPAAVFEAGTLHVMSRIGYMGLSSVLTVTAQPVMDEQGRLNVNIRMVRLGLVPVTALAGHVARQTADACAAELADWPEVEKVIRAIIDNAPFDPTFDFDKQRIWLREVIVEPGQLRLRLVPENMAVRTY